eukprot:CAMPEP_0167765528 /NCGR_PEP_ID=MMETSP0110_2-20121227/14751_1 /TAXON_ID=629695 /ORGANISM="Gymnochlora sp., Strain CCMP2014" /LENGTH=206 /DNA_ID=CAMNT_0007653279 /DNA_START=1541 /DNA_END=2162 /DNA_ORIENTATION=+
MKDVKIVSKDIKTKEKKMEEKKEFDYTASSRQARTRRRRQANADGFPTSTLKSAYDQSLDHSIELAEERAYRKHARKGEIYLVVGLHANDGKYFDTNAPSGRVQLYTLSIDETTKVSLKLVAEARTLSPVNILRTAEKHEILLVACGRSVIGLGIDENHPRFVVKGEGITTRNNVIGMSIFGNSVAILLKKMDVFFTASIQQENSL